MQWDGEPALSKNPLLFDTTTVFCLISFELIQASKNGNMTVVIPNLSIWKKTQDITRDGHKNSGFPSMYDSIYHAMAIEADGVFVTADKKHFAKTKQHGNICLLENWKDVFKK